LNFSPPLSGRHSGRATPSLRDDLTTAITTGGRSTYPAPIPVQTNPATSTINPSSLDHLIAAHNNTPRKCLDFKTPAEVFSAKLLHFKRDSTPSLRSG
jgi:hypothetical protein